MSHSKAPGKFVIVGASGGIGSALAKKLVRRGNHVFLASRESPRLRDLMGELNAPGCAVDATQTSEVELCFEEAKSSLGGVDGAANCVGSMFLKPAHLTTDVEWAACLAVNLTSAFSVVRAAGKAMTSGGSVVLVASAAARVGLPNHEAVAAAKAGVIGLAQSAAATYASRGLRFNVVAPGLVKTRMTQKIWDNERAASTSLAMHPLGRLGEPEDVASLMTWLLDPCNSWVSGEVFSLDGGLANLRSSPRS